MEEINNKMGSGLHNYRTLLITRRNPKGMLLWRLLLSLHRAPWPFVTNRPPGLPLNPLFLRSSRNRTKMLRWLMYQRRRKRTCQQRKRRKKCNGTRRNWGKTNSSINKHRRNLNIAPNNNQQQQVRHQDLRPRRRRKRRCSRLSTKSSHTTTNANRDSRKHMGKEHIARHRAGTYSPTVSNPAINATFQMWKNKWRNSPWLPSMCEGWTQRANKKSSTISWSITDHK